MKFSKFSEGIFSWTAKINQSTNIQITRACEIKKSEKNTRYIVKLS